MSSRAFLPIALLCLVGASLSASDRTVTVLVRTTIGERSSLAVSNNLLQIVVLPGSTTGTASLEFTAGVRTLPGNEALVVAEPLQQFDGTLTFSGRGEGVLAGALPGDGAAVIARYVGGGQRHARIEFTLNGVPPGTYTIPIRLFVTVL